VVRILDFGIARFRALTKIGRSTRPGTILGSVYIYLVADKFVDARTVDIAAISVTRLILYRRSQPLPFYRLKTSRCARTIGGTYRIPPDPTRSMPPPSHLAGTFFCAASPASDQRFQSRGDVDGSQRHGPRHHAKRWRICGAVEDDVRMCRGRFWMRGASANLPTSTRQVCRPPPSVTAPGAAAEDFTLSVPSLVGDRPDPGTARPARDGR